MGAGSVDIIQGTRTTPSGKVRKTYACDCPRCASRVGLKSVIKGDTALMSAYEKRQAERILVLKAHRDAVCAAPCPAADMEPEDVVRWIAETRERLGLAA